MEYINPKLGQIDYGRYQTYLESIRGKLPKRVYLFAANPCHFDLKSESSLHDAWLEHLNICELASGARREIRQLEIDLCLLGSFHDRLIELRYTGVRNYSFIMPPQSGRVVHGNLFTHEIRLSDVGLVIHELLFESGAALTIECSDVLHSEKIIAAAGTF